jgi:N-acetyl-alpha-D-glucosaminyl L-malate synthase BshA
MTGGKTPGGARAAHDALAPDDVDQARPPGRPLNIAVVCYPGLGGSGVVAAELALGLAERAHRVHVIATAVPERINARLQAGLDSELHFERVEVPTSPVFEHGPYDIAVASHLIELARREAIDLVHLHYAVPHAASGFLARQVLGAAAPAMVTTLHGTDVTRLGAHPSLHAVTAFALAACDGLTTPSHYLRSAAAERFGLPTSRIEVIPNFVDLERFAPPPQRDRDTGELGSVFAHRADGPVLFHVSNFRPIKRPVDLIEVLVRVRALLPAQPARLVLVGDGPSREAVLARARELGVEGAVGWLGRRDDVATLLRHADGFVLPSESEGFGVAALEAMAAGVPVFGYRVGGLPEVVVDGTGALVRCGDVDALAQVVVAGVRDRAIRDAMGRQGRARAERGFGRDAALTRYERYFRRVLASRSTNRIQGGTS